MYNYTAYCILMLQHSTDDNNIGIASNPQGLLTGPRDIDDSLNIGMACSRNGLAVRL